MMCKICTVENATFLLSLHEFTQKGNISPDSAPQSSTIIGSMTLCERCAKQANNVITEALGKWRGNLVWNYNYWHAVDDRKKKEEKIERNG